jgi:2-polyprenyl-3-methyl-5-hydroxy-6-metoxy-1,4-benzoquinol methylase
MIAALPHKFIFLKKEFQNNSFSVLDIGAGNHSATHFKKNFPNCKYYGVDLDRNYNNIQADFDAMECFYELDLTTLNLEIIPNNFFDAIVMAHIIEHLHNGTEVLKILCQKLKPNGCIYIEYPGVKSLTSPSREGTLNFYDDDTHVRLYSTSEINAVLEKENLMIIKSGTHRSIFKILLIPVKIIHNKIKYGKVLSSIFYDLFGFAEFVWARKK